MFPLGNCESGDLCLKMEIHKSLREKYNPKKSAKYTGMNSAVILYLKILLEFSVLMFNHPLWNVFIYSGAITPYLISLRKE